MNADVGTYGSNKRRYTFPRLAAGNAAIAADISQSYTMICTSDGEIIRCAAPALYMMTPTYHGRCLFEQE